MKMRNLVVQAYMLEKNIKYIPPTPITKGRKKDVVQAVMLYLLLFLFSTLNANNYTVAFVSSTPYQYTRSRTPMGLNIEILNAIAQQAEISFEYISTSAENALNLVKTAQVDAVISLKGVDVPQELVYFPIDYLSRSRNVIFARDSFEREVSKVEDLRNLTVGVIEEMQYGKDFDEYTGVFRDFSEDQDVLIRKFANNRNQLFISNEMLGHHLLKGYGLSNYKTLAYETNIQMFYLEIVRNRENAIDLLNLVNTAISELKETEVFEEIMEKYLKVEG